MAGQERNAFIFSFSVFFLFPFFSAVVFFPPPLSAGTCVSVPSDARMSAAGREPRGEGQSERGREAEGGVGDKRRGKEGGEREGRQAEQGVVINEREVRVINVACQRRLAAFLFPFFSFSFFILCAAAAAAAVSACGASCSRRRRLYYIRDVSRQAPPPPPPPPPLRRDWFLSAALR